MSALASIALPVLAADDPVSHILPHSLWQVGPVNVTNQLLMLCVAGVLMLLFFPLAARSKDVASTSAAEAACGDPSMLMVSSWRFRR